jgi:hypothetical protein
MTDGNGFCAWFHYLCKKISIESGHHGHTVRLLNPEQVTSGENNRPPKPLSQADYSYSRSGFFLRKEGPEFVTLVCFGANQFVRRRLGQFMHEQDAWAEAQEQPLILLDLVLEGIFLDVDESCWNINRVFGPLEHVSFPEVPVV